VQRRDTPYCPSSLREDVHSAVAQRAWYFLPGQAQAMGDGPCRGPTRSAQAMDRKERQGRRSLSWTVPWGPRHPSHWWYERLRWIGAAPQQGPVCGLALVEGFDNGRFLTALSVFDRHELPGFDVSSHLKGLGLLPRCLRCFCFPFRHVRSPQKSVSTMPRGTTLLLGRSVWELEHKGLLFPMRGPYLQERRR